MRAVYAGFSQTELVVTNPTTAEMIKYTANAFLALTISYANEIARICETLDGVVTLRGIATGPGFRRYLLDWRSDGPNVDFTSFDEVFSAVPTEGNLGSLDTNAFSPGLYWFRLRVLESQDYILGECSIRVRFK